MLFLFVLFVIVILLLSRFVFLPRQVNDEYTQIV